MYLYRPGRVINSGLPTQDAMNRHHLSCCRTRHLICLAGFQAVVCRDHIRACCNGIISQKGIERKEQEKMQCRRHFHKLKHMEIIIISTSVGLYQFNHMALKWIARIAPSCVDSAEKIRFLLRSNAYNIKFVISILRGY